jgi:Cof subfamily protein (haloacid dehalogenase superfamily)
MKTLYVSDLDGTLLRKDESISDFSLRTINGLIKSGMAFSYATARSIYSASVVTKGLELEVPVILHNGVFIIDTKTREKILRNGFSYDEVKTVSSFLNDHKIYPLVYSFIDERERVSWLSGQGNGGLKNYLNNRQNDKRLREARNTDELYQGDVFYFTCIGERDELSPVFDHFRGMAPYNTVFQLDIYYPEYWCEIMPKNATKASAILQLKKLYGFDRVVSFGDSLNDIPMFEISDECYATANAMPELKEKATGIIDSNEDDGVARWLLTQYEISASL